MANKTSKIKSKRVSQSQRKHVRRVKQAARMTVTAPPLASQRANKT